MRAVGEFGNRGLWNRGVVGFGLFRLGCLGLQNGGEEGGEKDERAKHGRGRVKVNGVGILRSQRKGVNAVVACLRLVLGAQ